MKTGRELSMFQQVITTFGKDPGSIRSTVYTHGSCLYNPPKSKPKSPGCAIGMYLDEKTAKRFDKSTLSSISAIFDDKKTFKLLPKWMQEMDVNFLSSLQELHDCTDYWAKKGLSKAGISQVKTICEENKIPFKKLKL